MTPVTEKQQLVSSINCTIKNKQTNKQNKQASQQAVQQVKRYFLHRILYLNWLTLIKKYIYILSTDRQWLVIKKISDLVMKLLSIWLFAIKKKKFSQTTLYQFLFLFSFLNLLCFFFFIFNGIPFCEYKNIFFYNK